DYRHRLLGDVEALGLLVGCLVRVLMGDMARYEAGATLLAAEPYRMKPPLLAYLLERMPPNTRAEARDQEEGVRARQSDQSSDTGVFLHLIWMAMIALDGEEKATKR